jgi:hypothetical protein
MSLTSHLDSANSPVREYLEASFPILTGTKRGSPLAKPFLSFLGLDKLPPCRLPTLAPKSNQGTIVYRSGLPLAVLFPIVWFP